MSEVSVDTYLKGKNTSRYRKHIEDEVTVLIAPALLRHAERVELHARRKLIGSKLVAVAYNADGGSCAI